LLLLLLLLWHSNFALEPKQVFEMLRKTNSFICKSCYCQFALTAVVTKWWRNCYNFLFLSRLSSVLQLRVVILACWRERLSNAPSAFLVNIQRRGEPSTSVAYKGNSWRWWYFMGLFNDSTTSAAVMLFNDVCGECQSVLFRSWTPEQPIFNKWPSMLGVLDRSGGDKACFIAGGVYFQLFHCHNTS
jgi:hypothetical protein